MNLVPTGRGQDICPKVCVRIFVLSLVGRGLYTSSSNHRYIINSALRPFR